MSDSMAGVGLVLKAATFAAHKHRDQRRQDRVSSPYINHPLALANVLANEGGVRDPEVIAAALLHDTVEDTATTFEELEREFGPTITGYVREVTDDKSLPKGERKRLQVEHAPHRSNGAKLVKLADKICNVRDVIDAPPVSWSDERRREYLEWSAAVRAGLGGVNPALEQVFDQLIERGLSARS